jgi:hypothetical protein
MDRSNLTDDDTGFFRLIANPHRLKPIRPPTVVVHKSSTFEFDISNTLKAEYRDVYVNAHLIDRIKQAIQKEMDAYIIDIVVADFVSEVTERCIAEYKVT